MLVRKMTAEDIPAVVEIEKECFSLPWSHQSFAESIAREDTIFLVCVDNTEVITGYIGMYLSFDEASVTNVAVASQFRKKGCGKHLVMAAKEAAKEAGATSIFLEVRFSNEPALSLYKRQGFEKIGIRKNFYQHPVEDAIIMKVGI